ncbi:hypothetical protein [Streptomyces sp. WM6378]|uniref:hypothetical protein n=1 Tax=Streptomyces sp. WM6378 TaxID=1415557 RepID=UPI0006C360AB|nr:hypothetical protein [Streptomyces sp. WM6378]KOU52881.1 hypothetical protein ADK54_06195 [Streptomyces sp. WM6378]
MIGSGRNTMTVFVTLLLGLLLVIAGVALQWPRWAWPVLAAVLVTAALAVNRLMAGDRDRFPPHLAMEPDLPIPPAPRQEIRVSGVALPSAVADYDFLFSATVRWSLLESPDGAALINPSGLAVDAVLHRAREITAGQPPSRSALVQHRLDGALATMQADSSGRLLAMALDVSLCLPDPDLERLAKLSTVRKERDVWEHERSHERNKRDYLGGDVLKDTGSAVVWWLSRNEDRIEETVDRIGVLARLTAAANNDEVAPEFRHLVPPPPVPPQQDFDEESPLGPETAQERHEEPPEASPGHRLDDVIAWFGFGPHDPDLALFAEHLVQVAEAHGKSEAAARIKYRFDGRMPEDPAETPPPGS